jgi:hypothetical protein
MSLFSAQIKYRYGRGKAVTSTVVGTTQLKGMSESTVLQYLREKHKSVKNPEIIIENIT